MGLTTEALTDALPSADWSFCAQLLGWVQKKQKIKIK